MDCPSEENLIRLKLESQPEVRSLEFDIPARRLIVLHDGQPDAIVKKLEELNLGSHLIQTTESLKIPLPEEANQRKLLWIVLLINFSFFIIEILTGLISRSMGLVADSLDMLADALVYGMSLMAVGGTLLFKKRVANAAGYLQIILAVLGFSEVIRRFINPGLVPDFRMMIIISALALIGNAVCLWILQKSKSREAHMQASMIFTSNDVIINAGVIAAGILVNLLNSNKPDLVIGTIVFFLVIRGALRILRLGK